MTAEQATIIDLHAKLRRAISAGDITSAEEIALQLAPSVEARCEELDRNPAAIVPQWGLLA